MTSRKLQIFRFALIEIQSLFLEFQGDRVYSESSLREMGKDGFYACIRKYNF